MLLASLIFHYFLKTNSRLFYSILFSQRYVQGIKLAFKEILFRFVPYLFSYQCCCCLFLCEISFGAVAPICYAHLAAAQISQFLKFDELSERSSSHSGGPPAVPELPVLRKNVRSSMFFCWAELCERKASWKTYWVLSHDAVFGSRNDWSFKLLKTASTFHLLHKFLSSSDIGN